MVAFFFPPMMMGQSRTSLFITSDDLGSGSSPSASFSIGIANSGRRVAAVIHWGEGGTHETLSSATIGGISAAIHVQRGHTGGATGLGVAIISAIVPTGTTATIATSFSGSVTDAYAGVWRLTGYNTVIDTDTDQASGSTGPLSVTIDTVSGGFVLGGYSGSSNVSQVGIAWTNTTERYDHGGFGIACRSGGADAIPSGTSLTVGATQGVNVNSGCDLVVVSWS